ncbi:MAG TPA: HAD-IA family hydrolase [Acidimicrobiales bacterium]
MKDLLLDFGGVLLLTPFELRAEAERSLGMEAGALSWAGPFDPRSDPLWQQWQAGEVTEREYWAIRAASYGLETQAFMAGFFEPGGDHLVRTEMWDLVRSYQRSGGRAAILTNDLRAFHGTDWLESITVLGEIDILIDASVTKVLKPDPRAYEAALAALGDPDPASVVFVDDQQNNLRGAQACGMVAVIFDPADVPGSIARVRAALELTPD